MPRGRSRFIGGTVFLAAVLSSTPWLQVGWGQEAENLELLPLPGGSGEPTLADPALVAPDQQVDGVEILTRGPVHEAYAEPVIGNVEAGPVLPKMPPEAVQEIPPDVKPEGENVIWIPGYWAWDDDADRYLWVSGIWRDMPPGRRWVPGYWTDVDGGAQWISGFWGSIEAEQVEYLAPPPASLDLGPPPTEVNNNQFWVPGVWVYQQTSYAWRPGYWQDYRENWIWVPAHYVWTPAGCVYVAGYWDYRLPYRGQLFAPAVITYQAYSRPGFRYRPYYTINASSLMLHLFIAPRHRHYYYGNYYGPTFAARHYYPFCDYHRIGHGYDPLFTYYHAHFRRQGVDYGRRMHDWHVYFDRHQDLRPPVTMHDHLEFAHKHRGHENANQLVLARSLDEERTRPQDGRRYVSADVTRDQLQRNADDLRRLTNVRHEQEHGLANQESGKGPEKIRGPKGPARWNLSPSLVNNSGKQPLGDAGGNLVDQGRSPADAGSVDGDPDKSDNPRRGPKFPGRNGDRGTRPGKRDVAAGNETPAITSPGSEKPNTDTPGLEQPGTNLPGGNLPGGNLPGGEVVGADTPNDSLNSRRTPPNRTNRGPRKNNPVVNQVPGVTIDGNPNAVATDGGPNSVPELPTNPGRVIRGQQPDRLNLGNGNVSDGNASQESGSKSRRTPRAAGGNGDPNGGASRTIPTGPPSTRRVPRAPAPTNGPISVGPLGNGGGNPTSNPTGPAFNQSPPINNVVPRDSMRTPRSAPRSFEPSAGPGGPAGRRSVPKAPPAAIERAVPSQVPFSVPKDTVQSSPRRMSAPPTVRSFSGGGESAIDSGSRRSPRMSAPSTDMGRPPRGAGGGGESGRAKRGRD